MKTTKTNADLTSNGLCHGCNLNQELKIRQLAKFTPTNASREEEELEKYRKYLERTYKLCRRCEAHLHQTLGEQSSWLKPKLLAFRLEMSRQTARSAQLIREAASTRVSASAAVLVWLTAVGLAGAVILNPSICAEATSATIGVILVAAVTRRVEMTASRVASLSCLVLLDSLALTDRRGLLRQEFQDIIRALVLVNAIITSFSTFGGKRRIQKTEKRVKSRANDSFLEETYRMETRADLSADSEEETMRQEERPSKMNASTSTQRTAATSANLDEQLLFHPDRELHLRPSSQLSCSASVVAGSVISRPQSRSPFIPPSPAASLCSFSAATPLARPPSAALSSRRNSSRNSNNSRCDISTLSLEDAEERATMFGQAPSIAERSSAFSTRTYDAFNSSGIDFGGPRGAASAARQRRGPFKLQPANKQLKNWVAGGYWQAPPSLSGLRGREGNLSRASSQTSGFVSESAAGAKEFALPPQFLVHSASRSCSRASSASDDSSVERLTQEAFAELRPKAESSPIEKLSVGAKTASSLQPLLERRISLDCSLYSLLLAVSVGANLALAVYFMAS